jgi:hypothetical protein
MKTQAGKACLLAFLVVAISSDFLLMSARATAAGKGKLPNEQLDGSDVQPQPLVINKHDGAKALQSLATRIRHLGAYKFDGFLVTLKDKGVRVDSGSFFYKPESCIRVEVKDGGFKSGSVLVRQHDGVIRAKGGPALLGMKMNLEPNSNMLMLANGLNIVECDYLSLLDLLQKQVASGQKVYASEGPLLIQPQNSQLLVLETIEAGLPEGSNLSNRILVDPQQLVPVQWDIFKQGKFFSTVRFKNFQACPSLDESLFHL